MNVCMTRRALALSAALAAGAPGVLLASDSDALTPQFVDTGAAIPGVDHSPAEWGDFDGDG